MADRGRSGREVTGTGFVLLHGLPHYERANGTRQVGLGNAADEGPWYSAAYGTRQSARERRLRRQPAEWRLLLALHQNGRGQRDCGYFDVSWRHAGARAPIRWRRYFR